MQAGEGGLRGSSGEESERRQGRGEGVRLPCRTAALTSALSEGLSTAIFCHGSASCASGIFPPSPARRRLHRLLPPHPPHSRLGSSATRAQGRVEKQQQGSRAAPESKLDADTDHLKAQRLAAAARTLSENLAPPPGTRARPFLPLLLPPPGLRLRPPPPLPAGSRARSQQNSDSRALPHFRSQHGV